MRIHLVTGGARSGKSRWAEREASRLGGDDVTYVATARALDDEMGRRIEKHRERRPSGWTTVEASTGTAEAITDATHGVVVLDCLTMLVSNTLLKYEGRDEDAALDAVAAVVEALLAAAGAREGDLIVVTNEVGSGVVPATPLGRWFRDAQGWANQRLAEQAVRVVMMVSGVAWTLKDSNEPGRKMKDDDE